MKKIDLIQAILGDNFLKPPKNNVATAFAPTNIALVKYWGKRNQELNLPVTSSLSISLGNKGAEVTLSISDQKQDAIFLNDKAIELESSFAKRLLSFLDLFRQTPFCLPKMLIQIQSNIPIAAGLASSACGFASIVKALNQLYGWNLTDKKLSILARLGSGSAARSLWDGFVEWHSGELDDGSDSHGEKLDTTWSEFCIGLLIMESKEKPISSRLAMQRTVETSKTYLAWPQKVSTDLQFIKQAITDKDFDLLGNIAESNALSMHETMLNAVPPINFSLPQTQQAMQVIQKLRAEGLQVYFTQDAGPNLKLLFLEKNKLVLKTIFPYLDVVQPFGKI